MMKNGLLDSNALANLQASNLTKLSLANMKNQAKEDHKSLTKVNDQKMKERQFRDQERRR